MSWKLFFRTLFLIAVLLWPSSIFSQDEATMLFLRIPPSPTLNGMGRVGVAFPSKEPLGFYYNPAQLGYLGQSQNFALQFYPSKTDWLPQFGLEDLTFNSLALIYGHNFNNDGSSSPLSLGFGYMRGEINYGENIQVNTQGQEVSRFDSKEYHNAFAVGVGLNFYVSINLGLTYKNVSSKLSPGIFVEDGPLNRKANENAFDYGILMTIPALRFFGNKFQAKGQPILPYFDVFFGYAKTNIGGEVEYGLKTQADPLPRTALMGYAISAGYNSIINDKSIRMVSFDWSSEANDLLVIRKANDEIDYQGNTGDINFWDNIILGKSDDKVENHHGFRLQFFDFVGVEFGQFNGPGWGEGIKTEGYTLNLKGLLITLSLAGIEGLDFAANHFDLQYSWSQYSTEDLYGPLNNTTHHSITFSVYGL